MCARAVCLFVILCAALQGCGDCNGGGVPQVASALIEALPAALSVSCDPESATAFEGALNLRPSIELGSPGLDRLFLRIQGVLGPLSFEVDGQPLDPATDEWEFADSSSVALVIRVEGCPATDSAFQIRLRRTASEALVAEETHAIGVSYGRPPPVEPPPGLQPNGLSDGPQIASAGSTVYAVWSEADELGFPAEIAFNRSLDGGTTWLPKHRVLSGDASWPPQVCASGDSVYVVWGFSTTEGDPARVLFTASHDAGDSWLPVTRLDTAGPFELPGSFTNKHPLICCDGDNVYVLWVLALSTNRFGLFVSASDDGGRNWLPQFPFVEDTNVAVSAALCCDGANVHLICAEGWPGDTASLFFHRSMDGGNTWSMPANQPFEAIERDGYQPAICCDGERVCVLAQRKVDGSPALFLSASRDGGGSWPNAGTRVDDGGLDTGITDLAPADFTCRGEEVFVVWQDRRDDTSPGVNANWSVYFNRSADLGSTWLAADLRLDEDVAAGGANLTNLSRDPRICRDATTVHVTWWDTLAAPMNAGQTPGSVIYHRSFDVAGEPGLLERVDADPDGENNTSTGPRISCDGTGRVYVVWTDRRVGGNTFAEQDIFFNGVDAAGQHLRTEDTRLDRK